MTQGGLYVYKDLDGEVVRVLLPSVTFNNGVKEVEVVVFQYIDIFKNNGGVRAVAKDGFNAAFEEVKWKGGVDLYAILHEHLNKDLAYEMARKIEAALVEVEHEPMKHEH